jgi:hypothetical protein
MSSRVSLMPAVLIALALPNLFALQKDTKADTARFGDPTSTARPLQDYIYGVVKKIDKTELTLDKTISGVDEVFKLEPKTKFIRDGKQSLLQDLKVGDQVFVEVKKNKKTGDQIAKKVVTGATSVGVP